MANNTILAKQKWKGHTLTKAQVLSSYGTTTQNANECIFTTDGFWTVCDGTNVLNDLSWIQIDFTTGAMTVDAISIQDTLARITAESTSGTSGLYVNIINGLAGYIYRIVEDGDLKFSIAYGCIDNLLRLIASAVHVGGAFVAENETSITTGTYDNIDVTGLKVISANTGGGNITLNGFTGGIDGQEINIIKISSSNSLIFANQEGTSDEDIFTQTAADVTYGTGRPMIILKRRNSNWYMT